MKSPVTELEIPKLSKSYWFSKQGSDFRRDPANSLADLHSEYGDILDLNVPIGLRQLSIHDAEMVKHVLITQRHNYIKDRSMNVIKLAVGNGLLTSEGDFWRGQRRKMQSAFNNQTLEQISKTMVVTTRSWLSGIKEMDKPFDLYNEMVKLTSQIAALALFGADVGDTQMLAAAIEDINKFLSQRMFSRVFQTQMWLPVKSVRSFRRIHNYISDLIRSIIRARRQSGVYRNDLLGLLLVEYSLESATQESEQQLIDECMTLFIAANETTACALTWTLYLLANHKDAFDKVRHEVSGAMDDKTAIMESLAKLSYTKQVIKESMRLYPPAWVIGREAVNDDVLEGYEVPKTTQIMISIYALHKNHHYWHNPNLFDPDRFSPENAKNQHDQAYIPFGSGARMCIGKNFALMEMQLILKILLQQGSLHIIGTRPVNIAALVTLKPEGKIMAQWNNH
jgi:cytochrome P450